MEEPKEEFNETINEQFKRYCDLKEIEPTFELFTRYLIERNLIQETTIKKFMVVDKYPEALSKNFGSKTIAIYELEDRYGASFSSIRMYLDRFSTYFRLKSDLNRNC